MNYFVLLKKFILYCFLLAVHLNIHSQEISYKWERITPSYETADAQRRLITMRTIATRWDSRQPA